MDEIGCFLLIQVSSEWKWRVIIICTHFMLYHMYFSACQMALLPSPINTTALLTRSSAGPQRNRILNGKQPTNNLNSYALSKEYDSSLTLDPNTNQNVVYYLCYIQR
jgi:hypothetical protein